MISGRAVSVDGAISTRVNTLFIPACQVVGTLRIRETFILPASLIWVSFVAWPALASCSVVSDTTFSVQATLFKCARVQTFSIVTGFYDGAFVIRLAASCVENKKQKLLFCSHPKKTTTSLRSSQISWGFPTSPGLQTHMARWFLTLHSAPIPQDSVKHGFSHFSFMHARWEGQSGSTKHSGWGAEKESFMQVRNLWTWCAAIFDWLSWKLYCALSTLNTLYTLFW